MNDAYSIAVKIALVENVTRGLAMMARHFRTTDAEAMALERRLQSIGKMVAVGGALAGAGAFGIGMLKKPIEEAVAYQQEMAKLQAQGVGDAALAQADKFAKSQKIIGASSRDALKMVAESNSVLRDMTEAIEVSPRLLKMKFGMEAVMSRGGYGEGHGSAASDQFMAALKTSELRGALVDPITQKFSQTRFNQTLDFMTRAYTASGGLVKPTDYLSMIKTGGMAAKNLNDQMFYFGLMHMMQESGGSRTGTSLMSGFQNMYMGRTTQQVAEMMLKDKLLDKSKLHYGKTGHITKLDPGSIVDAELFRTNQFAYLMQVLVPKLKAQGISDGAAMELAIGTRFSNRTAANLWTTMYRERANIQKHMNAAQGAMGVDQLADLGAKTPNGQMLDLLAKEANLKKEIGDIILPKYVQMLGMLRDTLQAISDWGDNHKVAFKGLVMGFTGLSIASLAAGSLSLLVAGFKAFRIIGAPIIRFLSDAALLLLRFGRAIMLFGRFLLANPIGLALLAIITVGWLVYNNWKEIKGGLLKIWDAIKDGVLKLFSGDFAGAFHSFASAFLRGWQLIFNTIIAGVNTILPAALQIGKTHFADDYENAHRKPADSPYIRPAQPQQHLGQAPVYLNGKIVGVIGDALGKLAGRPNTGSSTFDPSRSLASTLSMGF